MKNCREIFLAKDAGMVSYPGLPGHIKTGCTTSPAYKSRYCKNHQTRVCEAVIHQGMYTYAYVYTVDPQLSDLRSSVTSKDIQKFLKQVMSNC